MPGTLYLIPTPLDTARGLSYSQPEAVSDIIVSLRHWRGGGVTHGTPLHRQPQTRHRHRRAIVRGAKTNIRRPQEIEGDVASGARRLRSRADVRGGCTCRGRPGAELVAAAHRKGIKVVPLVGASSIIMSLMASGLTGQTFTFNGYPPGKGRRTTYSHRTHGEDSPRRRLQPDIHRSPVPQRQTIGQPTESPVPAIRLTVACDITSGQEYIRTDTVAGWRKTNIPTLHKKGRPYL